MSNLVGDAIGSVSSAGAGLLRRLQRFTGPDRPLDAQPRSRWRAVTINRSPEQVLPNGQVPPPLAALGSLVDIEVRPAPGGKGTELRARLRDGEPSGASGAAQRVSGDDPRQRVRAALREAKALLEVGEVLRVDPAPHGQRGSSPAGKLVDAATRRAGGEGVS